MVKRRVQRTMRGRTRCIDGVATRVCVHLFEYCGHAGGHLYVYWICNGYRGGAEFVFQASDIDTSHLGSYGHALICGIAQIARMRFIFHYCIYICIRLSNRTHSEILVVIHQMKTRMASDQMVCER